MDKNLLEMRPANKVARMYTFNRTNLMANTTSGALLIIDSSQVVLNLDRTAGAGLLTLTATDTAVEADLADLSTLIVARAFHNYTRGIVDQADNTVRTFLDAKTASDALSGIDLGDILFGIDADGISRADLYTVAVAEAGEGAEAVTGIIHISGNTGGYTLVVIFSFFGCTGAIAGNVGNLFNHVIGLKTHNRANLAGNTVATGHAE